MAEPVGDETFERGIEKARAALGGRPRRRSTGPAPVDLRDVPPVTAGEPEPTDGSDGRDLRIAELEAEVRRLRAALARIHDQSHPGRA